MTTYGQERQAGQPLTEDNDNGTGAKPARPGRPSASGHNVRETCMSQESSGAAYWKANIRIVTWCLVIWALVSFGFGIVFRPLLSGIAIGGTDLGFWFAQQGSIFVFMFLIFFYAIRMNALDREHGVDEE